jgi:threonine/homoserine/homoserine lactone efflux protein
VDASFFFKGSVLGFLIAAPVGPIGVLCIRRSVAHGRTIGLLSGLGAATADALYGCVAAFGLTAVSDFLVGHRFWVRLIGGTFLAALGVKTLLSKPSRQPAADASRGWMAAYASTLFLTLTNPMTILSFAAVFAGLGVGTSSGEYLSATALVAGVFAGSALWWLILSTVAGLGRSRINARWMQAINWLAGGILLGFGLYAWAGATSLLLE